MSRRNAPRSSSSSDAPAPDEAFEVGHTTLSLDDISEEELDTLSFDEADRDTSMLNGVTVSGLSLLLAGLLYLLTEINLLSSASLLGLGMPLPVLVGLTVLIVGTGLLAWRTSRSASHHSRPAPSPMPSSLDPSSDDEQPSPSNRLVRSRTDKRLLGVCGGLANYLDLDPTLVRIAFVIGTLFFGSLLLAYVGLAFAMPKAPPSASNEHPTRPHDVPKSD